MRVTPRKGGTDIPNEFFNDVSLCQNKVFITNLSRNDCQAKQKFKICYKL